MSAGPWPARARSTAQANAAKIPPDLPWRSWEPTVTTVHHWLQIVGRIRMVLTPREPHWGHVPLEVTVEIGRTRLAIRDLLQLGQGSVVELAKLAGEPLDVLINGRPIARGEAVMVNDRFGVRLTDIISPSERIAGLR